MGGLSELGGVYAAARDAEHLALHCWNSPILHRVTLHCLATMEPRSGPLGRWAGALETTTLPERSSIHRPALDVRPGGVVEIDHRPGVGAAVEAAALEPHLHRLSW
jgi:L-alanine-DL-glutamate epimerase-like enolase superfamily enzyme